MHSVVYVWLLVAVLAAILLASAAYDAHYRRRYGRTPKIGRYKRQRLRALAEQRRQLRTSGQFPRSRR